MRRRDFLQSSPAFFAALALSAKTAGALPAGLSGAITIGDMSAEPDVIQERSFLVKMYGWHDTELGLTWEHESCWQVPLTR